MTKVREVALSNSTDVALIDDVDWCGVRLFRWADDGRYAKARLMGKRVTEGGINYRYPATIIYMHHLILPRKEGYDVDHINRNKLDNRRSNLRYLTRSENMRNTSWAKNPLAEKAGD